MMPVATWYSRGWNRWWVVLAIILMSTSARLSALAAVRPPKPEPMMTTLCLSVAVAPGWLIFGLLDGLHVHLYRHHGSRQGSQKRGEICHAPVCSSGDQRPQLLGPRGDAPRLIPVQAGDWAEDHPGDARVENLGLDLVGHLIGATKHDIPFEIVRDQ